MNFSFFKQEYQHYLLFFLIGFTAIICQVIYIREFMVVFYGNELTIGFTIAMWLFWTAFGSISTNRLIKKFKKTIKLLRSFLIFIALFSPLTVLFIRLGKSLLTNVSGEILGPIPISLISCMILFPICFLIGGLFTLAASEFIKDPAQSTGTVYKYEAIGSAVGGVIFSIILVEFFNAFQILFFISCSIIPG